MDRDRKLTSSNFLKHLYLVLATIFIVALIVHTKAEVHYSVQLFSESTFRAFYGFLAAIAVVFYSYYLVFVRKTDGSVIDILRPVFFFNFVIVILFYYSRFDFGLPINDFKVGFTYSNFWDFYYQVLTAADKSYVAINTGYLPFSYAVAKTFAKLAGWKHDIHPIGTRVILIYTLYMAIFISPLFLFAKHVVKTRQFDKDTSFFLLIFLAISYPVLFVVERGNFLILSFFFLSLVVYFYHQGDYRRSAIFAAFLISVKVFNFIYLIFIFRRLSGYWKPFMVTLVLLSLLSLLVIFGFHIEKWGIFKYALTSPVGGMIPDAVQQVFVMTDGGKLQGGSSIDSYRVLIRTLLVGVKQNLTTDMPVFNLACMAIGAVWLGLFYAFRRKQLNWKEEILVLSIIPMLFHAQAAEYNLMLLMPCLMLICADKLTSYQEVILKLSGLYLMLSGGVVIALIDQVTSGPASGVYNSVTPKSFLVPFSLFGILWTIYFKRELHVNRAGS